MQRSTARYFAKQAYAALMYRGLDVTEPCPGMRAYVHEGEVYLWHMNGFDGVWIVPVAKSWI